MGANRPPASVSTGPITNIDITIATPYSTMFEGTCCTPMAFLKINNTAEILRNDVAVTAINGSTDNDATVTIRPIGLILWSIAYPSFLIT